MELKLDSKTFKALANEKRVDMLKLLGERRHTQSEIASELGLAVPTVKEHLSALVTAGLVEQHDEGRKWKYYSLTKSGKAVLAPEETKIWIMLGVFLLSAVGAVYRFFSLRSIVAPETAMVETFAATEPAADAMAMKAAPVMEAAPEMLRTGVEESAQLMAQAPQISPIVIDGLTLSLIIVAAAALIFMLGFYFRQRRYVAQLGKNLKKS
jgi:DNA-binding transcriptional ArsR family regulator